MTNYKNTVFYTGVTDSLERRVWQYKRGVIKNSFSKRYKLYKLVWWQEFSSPEEAIAAEKKIKGCTRKKKIELIKKSNPYFRDLADKKSKKLSSLQ